MQSKMKFLKRDSKNMVITFSILSFIYALFYVVIIISKADIDYVEDIISLNVQKLKNKDIVLVPEEVEDEDKGYQIKQVI